jgi:V8-like Glu-specific endopeptidase
MKLILACALLVIAPVIFAAPHPGIGQNGEHSSFSIDAITLVKQIGNEQFCSGALISDRMVLTALHCVLSIGMRKPHPAESLQVGFGPSVHSAKTKWLNIQEIRIANGTFVANVAALSGKDFAILVLAESVNLEPILIAEHPFLENSRLLVAGFGEDRFGFVGMRHTTHIRRTTYEGRKFAFVGGGCKGDSGGPILNHDGKLVGILSYGISRHCTPNVVRFAEPLATFKRFISFQNQELS